MTVVSYGGDCSEVRVTVVSVTVVYCGGECDLCTVVVSVSIL